MRVALCSFGFVEYALQLAGELSKRCELLLLMPQRPWVSNNFSRLVEVQDSLKTCFYRQPRFFDPRNILTIFKMVKEIDHYHPQILHLQGIHLWLWPWLPYLRRKYIIVNTMHDPVLHPGERYLRNEFLHYMAVKFSHRIIVHGEKLRELTLKKYGLHQRKVYSIPHGQLSLYKMWENPDIPEERNTILFFGRIKEYKGLEYLIEAEPLISQEIPGAKIIIAGKGDDFTRYEQRMQNREHFEIHNEYIPPEGVAELFQRASVVVLPYTDASQSGIVAIAYAFKKPVVVTNVGSLPEVVKDGTTGFIVPPRNSQKLAEAVIKLLQDDALRKNMGKNASRFAKTELSWGRIAEKTLELYRETLKSR